MASKSLAGRLPTPQAKTPSCALPRATSAAGFNQFYADADVDAPVRIDLPSGSYIAELRRVEGPTPSLEVDSTPESPPPSLRTDPLDKTRARRIPGVVLFVAGALCLALGGLIWKERFAGPRFPPTKFQPWATLLQSDRSTRIIFCDADMSLIQHLLGFHITLSDYANRRYWPSGLPLTPETQKALDALRGTKVAFVDSTIALNISSLAATAGRPVKTHTARSLQLLDFKTDDNFVLLGSPRSNPWFGLFADKLDFHFENDEGTKQEIIVNKRPLKGELSRYLPTAKGGGTGQAYSILAFMGNPGQRGNVLLLAGSNAEATEAAGSLAANVEQLTRTLRECGIDPSGGAQPFEMLLRVSTMAGSSNTFEVMACHRLRP